MKKLYIRYFKDKTDTMPHDSNFICESDKDADTQFWCIHGYVENVVDWMKQYPNGKVDFVWLNS